MTICKENSINSRAFWVFVPLVLLYAASYFQRTALPGTIYNTLSGELSLNAAQMANLSAAFVYPYAVFQLISGSLIDRFCGSRVVTFGGIVFCAGILLFPLCSNLYLLYFSRILTGIGASVMYLSVVKESDRLFGRTNYSVMFGIGYFVGYGGGLLGSLPFEKLCSIYHWQSVLLTAALISIVIFLIFLIGKNQVPMPPIPQNKFSLRPFKRILTNPRSYFVITCSSTNFCTYFIIQTVFGKKFLQDFAHFDSSAAAAIIFMLTLVCMFVMLTTSFLTRLTGNRRRPLILCASGLCAASSLMMTLAIHFKFPGWCFAVFYCLFAAAAGIPPIFTMVMQEVNSKDNMTQSAAVSNMFCYLAVAICSQFIGWMLDRWEKTKLPDGSELYSPQAYFALFCIVSAVTVTAFIIAHKIPETRGQYLRGTED